MSSNILANAIASTRRTFMSVAAFSCVVNILMLTGPLFMLQIYDRVLTSRSVPTLIALTGLVVGLYFFMGIIDLVRYRILTRIGHRFDEAVGRSAFLAQVSAPVQAGPLAAKSEPVRDVDQLRQFFSSPGVTALFDMPWMPIYIAIVFAIHPMLGMLALLGAVILFTIAFVTDRVARPAMKVSGEFSTQRNAVVNSGRRNAEVLHGMGMLGAVGTVWDNVNEKFLAANAKAADVVGLSSVMSKIFRLFLQSAVLALGAYLAIEQYITPGAMIASSIIMARGLQPVEMAVQNWRGMLAAQQAYRRLKTLFDRPTPVQAIDLPAPHRDLTLDAVTVLPPGSRTPTLLDIRFQVKAGTALGIIGQSGSGKSTLARALVGVWPAARGTIALDGAPLPQWKPETLGRHVGYLPQDVELFEGTIAQNIARFDPEAQDEKIIAAAKIAGCHDLVLSFKDGYSTAIGDQGATLSAGQRQRIALARALYGDPFLIVLDEPNSNLDGYGDSALNRAITICKQRGAIIVVVAHRPSALSATDKLCLIENGRMADFGDRDEVLKKVMRREKVDNVRPTPQLQGRRPAASDGADDPQQAEAATAQASTSSSNA
ncbi:type I secretion system permease/ATPase [Acuticoccus sediminis]|uniref:Type I secretion system permease/ATPase n=1 Tax=Acuticoccus sediminis TaxID=2184697 RepID=A0A8B2NWV1_9HYPH|nr:type I secretion system permease/ATPase [Acuticoccus sediminis]RAI03321.1 type I secretion system permease/ATPase [Acuticoccus sediminis]